MKLVALVWATLCAAVTADTPSWAELDERPLPDWYHQAKFGIFIHWGVFAVPAYGSEWFWQYWRTQKWSDFTDFINKTEGPGFEYQEYADRFKAEFYDPRYWADVFGKAGAQYVVLTSKHHEGFCNWNTSSIPTTWNWNAMDRGPHRDLLGDLAVEVKKQISPHTSKPLKFGLYHSLYEWYNPLYLEDKRNQFQTQRFVDEKSLAELYDLVERYEPEVIWSDGEWETTSDYWKAREFLHWYATNSSVASTAVWNDRWGNDTKCKHGGFMTCTDRWQPSALDPRKWEDCLTVDKTSWGYNRNATLAEYMTVGELVESLLSVVAKNGNMLLNVGPAADGTIHPIFIDRLLGMGEWLSVNGEAIYETDPWKVCQNETNVYYTRKAKQLYVAITKWPLDNRLRLSCPVATEETTARMLGIDAKLAPRVLQTSTSSGLELELPALTPALIPCQHAWVVELTGVANLDDEPETSVQRIRYN